MAIDFRKYVNIVSGVGGAASVKVRDLILRIFTTSLFVDPNSVLEFTSAGDVGTFFGTDSDEYARAVFYFGWISPLIGSADKISYARYPNAAAGAAIFGGKDTKSLLTLQAAVTGKILFVVDGVQVEISVPTLAAAGSFAAMATIIQTAVTANASFTGSTVTFDAPNNQFVLQLAVALESTSVTVIPDAAAGEGQDLGVLLEWTLGTGAVPASKVTVKAPADMFNDNVMVSNNFGSFVVPAITELTDVIALAETNATYNVFFQYHVSVSAENALAWSAALLGIEGVALTLESPATALTTEYPEMCEPIILAATDYSKRNAVMAAMYKVFNLTPSVTDTTLSNTYDAARVNYYGITQNAGQNIAFYQRGKLMGGTTAPVDMNIYGNEQWLKADISVDLINLQLGLGQISPDESGIAQVLGTIQQGGVTGALFNGVIAIGKPLTPLQKLFITNQTGDALAWQQVLSIGYWLNAVAVSSVQEDGSTEWAIDYTLIYSKNDSVRTINGTHELI